MTGWNEWMRKDELGEEVLEHENNEEIYGRVKALKV